LKPSEMCPHSSKMIKTLIAMSLDVNCY
jgi:hypothetical protein